MKKEKLIPYIALGTMVAVVLFGFIQLATAGEKVNKNPMVMLFYLIIGGICLFGAIRMFSRWRGEEQRNLK